MGAYAVFFAKSTRDHGMGLNFLNKHGANGDMDFFNAKYYAYLGCQVAFTAAGADGAEELFSRLQGENREWADFVRPMLGEKSDCWHTSMSVGDVLVEIATLKAFYCDNSGFVEVDFPAMAMVPALTD